MCKNIILVIQQERRNSKLTQIINKESDEHEIYLLWTSFPQQNVENSQLVLPCPVQPLMVGGGELVLIRPLVVEVVFCSFGGKNKLNN